jgi:hypothetical protein
MLARRLTTILPDMTLPEAIETIHIHRVTGLPAGFRDIGDFRLTGWTGWRTDKPWSSGRTEEMWERGLWVEPQS